MSIFTYFKRLLSSLDRIRFSGQMPFISINLVVHFDTPAWQLSCFVNVLSQNTCQHCCNLLLRCPHADQTRCCNVQMVRDLAQCQGRHSRVLHREGTWSGRFLLC
ncbi:hypothetical protein EGW08_023181 [Elysia chlorotica]|uniref:Uncharacterized protein n=1 Tax=Elysia chlorotica TaxID=188477 RepID=A0A433SJ74_ELYCH|nr:hypothetical protein EGW08_023181 [Elysia chlorotica]